MRGYSHIVQRIEALSHPYMANRVLGGVAGYPVFGLSLSTDGSLPVIFVNGGTHGDEPAGVEAALAFLEQDQSAWLTHLQFEVIPCLCPYGYVNDTRFNAQDLDINWAFLRDDVPEIGMIQSLIDGRRFAAVVDLHEDWESPGYYVYEQYRNRPALGFEITRQVSEVCPLNLHAEIEGEISKDGVVHPNLDVERRRKGEGIPIALFQQRYTDHLITSETPTERPLPARVQAHLMALETMIAAHSNPLADP